MVAARRLLPFAFAAMALTGRVLLSAEAPPAPLSPYIPQPLPQIAENDFDGDGTPDVALLEKESDGSHVLVKLSGSDNVFSLNTNVESLIARDIDGDGDIDLVGAAAAGPVTAWLNDGHGVFTARRVSSSVTLTSDSVSTNAPDDGFVADRATGPLIAQGGALASAGLQVLPLVESSRTLVRASMSRSTASPRAPPLASLPS